LTEGLLRIAAIDLESAQASSDPVVFREGAWGFWLQQSVEKALKAWLLHLGSDPPLTHDLRRRLLLLAQLNVYAVRFRYDADPTPPSRHSP
jgi:HEPN domain-containing protein